MGVYVSPVCYSLQSMAPLSPGRFQQRNHALAALMRGQHGLVSRPQVVALGVSRSALSRRLTTGVWQCLLPSVYAAAQVPPSAAQHLKAVELWAGDGAALSHRSALKLWGLPSDLDFVEVSTVHRHPPQEGIRCHLTRPLPPSQVVERDGLRVTSAEKTLVDMAAVLKASPDELHALLDGFLQRGLVTPEGLEALRDIIHEVQGQTALPVQG